MYPRDSTHAQSHMCRQTSKARFKELIWKKPVGFWQICTGHALLFKIIWTGAEREGSKFTEWVHTPEPWL